MRSPIYPTLVRAITFLAALSAIPITAPAQGDEINGGRGRIITTTPVKPGRKPSRKPRMQPLIVKVTPTTGSLTVVAEPKAYISVVPLNGDDPDEGTVPANEKAIIFNDLPPGRYRVTAQLQGHRSDPKEVVIKRNTPDTVTLSLVPITYNLTINSNVKSAGVMYRPKTGSQGQQMMMMRLQDGHAVLPNLPPGDYELEIEPEEGGYNQLRTSIEVAGDKTVELPLERIVTSSEFSWADRNDWDAPNSWHVKSGKLFIDRDGLAIPRNTSFRNYKDFLLVSQVNMVNGIAASFALRVKDADNYYLVQLTGPKADEPYVLRGFVIQKGVLQRFGTTIPLSSYTATLKQNQFFKVELLMVDNNIKVTLEDHDTGEPFTLGVLTDNNRTFSRGAVGLAARNGEQNEVGRFIVIPK